MKTKVVTALILFLTGHLAYTCEVSRALTETHFVIDPATKMTRMESKVNNAQLEVERCDKEEKYLLINFNSIYFQNDTSRLESISGQLLQNKSNCSIESDVPFTKADDSFTSQAVSDRNRFLKQCVQIVIRETNGFPIKTHPKSQCKITPLNAEGSIIQTDGNGCMLQVNPISKLEIQQKIQENCLDSNFLNENKIQAGDYESLIKLWPVAEDSGQLKILSPIGLRYVRHTLLPTKGFMPRSIKDNITDMPFVSVLSTNIHPGNIQLYSVGTNKTQLQPTFLVENISKEYCSQENCARPSSYIAPIAASLKLYKYDEQKKKSIKISEWIHALKIPANWSGLAEFKYENNLSGTTLGSLETDYKFKSNEEYTLTADFYEPRTTIDEAVSSESYLDLNASLTASESISSDHLPALPSVGQLGRLEKLATLPTIGLGNKTFLEMSDQFNMKKNWTHHYDRVCNAQNQNCLKLSGLNTSFISLKIIFRIDENKMVIPVRVEKKSPVFDNYSKEITRFAKKVCQ